MTRLTNQIPQEKKSLVLNTAEELFAEYGFDGTSIKMIREKSGVNTGMIYYYFHSKDGLYLAIFEFRLKQILDEVLAFANLDLEPNTKLEAYLQALIDRIESNHSLHRLLTNQLGTMQHPEVITLVSEARKQVCNLIRGIVQEGIKTGCFRAVDEEVFALNVISLLPTVLTGQKASLLYSNNQPLNPYNWAALAHRIITYLLSSITIIEPLSHEVSNG